MPLKIVRNNIVNMEVDAIVDSSNPVAQAESGITKSIHDAAGEKLMEKRIMVTGGKDLTEGEVIITDTDGCKEEFYPKYVFHVCTPFWTGGYMDESEKLVDCYKKVLKQAHLNQEINSIAFPLLCTGNRFFPIKEAMKIAVSTIFDFLFTYQLDVSLVLFGKEAFSYGKELFGDVIQTEINDDDTEKVKKENANYQRRREHNQKIQQGRKYNAVAKINNLASEDKKTFVNNEDAITL